MIDVAKVLEALPSSNTFCSVQKLQSLVEMLRRDSRRLKVEIVGWSRGRRPIYHVRSGAGAVKVLVVGGPHAHEPIGSLTVWHLLTLLQQGCPPLCDAAVEWHIVPCVDPDGAILNEGWSQRPFTFERYMKHFYVQPYTDQVDWSFPVTHKNLVWTEPSDLAKILKKILDTVRPDFYQALHNTRTGGAFFYLSRDIGRNYYSQMYDLLAWKKVPLQKRPIGWEILTAFAEGVVEQFTVRKQYDHLERTLHSPEASLRHGASSWEYLTEIKPGALTFVAEMGYARHPFDESEKETGQNLRKFKLRVDAESKSLAVLLLDEWERVKEDLDPESPFYRAVVGGAALPQKEKLLEGGMPLSFYPTQDILFNPKYDKTMTEADVFDSCVVSGGFVFLRSSYQFVRLLKSARQTEAVRRAVKRLEVAFDEALSDISRYVDFERLEVIDCGALAAVQLGSGLIALNSILEERGA